PVIAEWGGVSIRSAQHFRPGQRHAGEVAMDVTAPAQVRRTTLRDRILTFVARLLTRAFFRSVEVEGPPPPPGPVILAASHLYGFVDPVVLVARLGVLPRFLAKATLWKTAVARPLLGFARVIPVHRRVDG